MTPPRRVTLTDSAALLQPAIERLRAAGVQVDVLPAGLAAQDAVPRCAGSPVLIVGVLRLAAEHLRELASTGTTAIIRAGIGYDNVDADAARECSIAVANVPDYCVDEVADHATLLLLAAIRRLGQVAALARWTWQVIDLLPPTQRVRGQTLGLVGFGRISRQVAIRATGFGFRVTAFDPLVDDRTLLAAGVQPVGLDELFRRSDAVSLHCPLTPGTRRLVDADRLATMPAHAVLVNTSRGELVDLDAVDDALANGRLGAVALDVLDGEPDPPLGHPLLSRPEVLVTPHTAWYSQQARRELAVKSADEALRWLDGQGLRHRVNP